MLCRRKRSSYTYGQGFFSQDENKIRFKFIVYIYEFQIELITEHNSSEMSNIMYVCT